MPALSFLLNLHLTGSLCFTQQWGFLGCRWCHVTWNFSLINVPNQFKLWVVCVPMGRWPANNPGLGGLDVKTASSVGTGETLSAYLFPAPACHTEWEGQLFTSVSSVGVCTQDNPGSVGFPFVDTVFNCGLCVLISSSGRLFIFCLSFLLCLLFYTFSMLINIAVSYWKQQERRLLLHNTHSALCSPGSGVSNTGRTLPGRQMLCHWAVPADSFLKHTFHRSTVCLKPFIDFLSLYCQNEKLASRRSCVAWHLSVFLTLAGTHCRHRLSQSRSLFGIPERSSLYRLGVFACLLASCRSPSLRICGQTSPQLCFPQIVLVSTLSSGDSFTLPLTLQTVTRFTFQSTCHVKYIQF